MSNNNNAKDINDLRQKGIDPLSVPLEEVGGDRPETDLEGAPILRWKGADPDWWTENVPPREWLVRAGNTEEAPGYIPVVRWGFWPEGGPPGKRGRWWRWRWPLRRGNPGWDTGRSPVVDVGASRSWWRKKPETRCGDGCGRKPI